MAECNFEKDLEKLEKIVAALEEGGLSLDDSLKQFEQGIKLARRCERALSEAEKKIEVLTRKASGELAAEPFDDDTAPAEAGDKPKGAKPAVVEETVVSEKSVEIVAEKRRVVNPDDNGSSDDEDDDDEGTLLF